jgi:hypothetical protein
MQQSWSDLYHQLNLLGGPEFRSAVGNGGTGLYHFTSGGLLRGDNVWVIGEAVTRDIVTGERRFYSLIIMQLMSI